MLLGGISIDVEVLGGNRYMNKENHKNKSRNLFHKFFIEFLASFIS
jgi:hypothetical protein